MTTPFKSTCWLGSAVDSNRNYLVDVDVQTVFLRQPDQILHAPPQLLNRRRDSLVDGLVHRVRRTLRPTTQRVRLNCLWGMQSRPKWG
jgi:hypothetical protein